MSDDSLELLVEVPDRRRTAPVLCGSFTAEDGFGRCFDLRDQTLEEDEMYGVLPIWEEYEAQANLALY